MWMIPLRKNLELTPNLTQPSVGLSSINRQLTTRWVVIYRARTILRGEWETRITLPDPNDPYAPIAPMSTE